MALNSNTLAVVRQRLSSMVGDLIMGTFASGTSTTGVHTSLTKADDYYNELGYKCYIYGGVNIGEERVVSDWTLTTPANTLTFTPAFTSPITSTSAYELHRIFSEDEYRKAINQAIDSASQYYFVPVTDETTIRLTSTTDNLDNVVYTYEYSLPTTLTHLSQVITESSVSGVKLTGTVSGAFTAGETITGGSSGATGELSYGPAGGSYIRVRKVSGTFEVGETATGTDSGETCSAITAVGNETAGMGIWQHQDIIDTRDWDIVKTYSGTADLRLNADHYFVNEDLYLRLEGYQRQAILSSDTGVCYLPIEWLCWKAVTLLPPYKIESSKLNTTYQIALDNLKQLSIPRNYPDSRARRVMV